MDASTILGNNEIDDVKWLCSLTEAELELLMSLKNMVNLRAKKIGQEPLAKKFDLKMLRALSFSFMEHLKEQLKDLPLEKKYPSSSFASMTVGDLYPYICSDGRKRIRDMYLGKLYLSGLSYPWEEMREIASLPFLSSLKLKNIAFQGPEWEVEDEGFNNLETLVIEDVGMVDWIIGDGAFKDLRSLTMKNCYKLENIYGQFGKDILEIEIFYCKPSFTEEIINATPKEARLWILNVHTSWDEKLQTTYGSLYLRDSYLN